MTKKKLGYIELEWTCPACGSRNPGTTKNCRNCGAAMPEDVEFELPVEQELDTSAETAERVAAGPDFYCPYCGARNPGNATTCSQCGGDFSDAVRRKHGGIVGAFETGSVPDVTCPHCGAKNPAAATKCSQCGGTLEREEPEKKPKAAPSKERKGLKLGCLAAFVLLIAAMIYITRGRTETLSVVQDVAWTYQIEIEELQAVTHEEWHDELPTEAKAVRCKKKVRRTVSEPVPGATEVCGTPYVKDTGTGKGEVVQDCQYQIAEDWCTYTLNEWRPVGEEEATGHDFDPYWPTLKLGANQRAGERSERYRVFFLADDKKATYRPSSLEEYRQFQVGSQWQVKINRLGGVTLARPPK